MKRLWFVPLLLLVAVALYASTTITLNPSEMKSGETKKLVDGDKTITVTRDGEALDIRIEGGGSSNKVTISRGTDGFRIEREGAPRTFLFPPGLDLPQTRIMKFRNPSSQTWFVCPKDHTLMRVPSGKEDATFKCPVDGTTMEKRKGHGFAFFYDDDGFDSESL